MCDSRLDTNAATCTEDSIQYLVEQLKAQDDKPKASIQDIAAVKHSVNELGWAAETSSVSAIEEQVALVNVDMAELTDSLKNSIDAKTDEMKHMQLGFERRFEERMEKQSLDVRVLVNTEAQTLLTSTMKAAFTPLVEHIASKLLEFERRLDNLDVT